MLTPAVGGAEADRWLDEDLTDEFEAGVRRRQKRLVWLTVGRVAAVAAVVVLVFVIGRRVTDSGPAPKMTEVTMPAPKANPVLPVMPVEQPVAEVKPSASKRVAKPVRRSAATKKPSQTAPAMSPEEAAWEYEKEMMRKAEEAMQKELALREMERRYEEKVRAAEEAYAEYVAKLERLEAKAANVM